MQFLLDLLGIRKEPMCCAPVTVKKATATQKKSKVSKPKAKKVSKKK